MQRELKHRCIYYVIGHYSMLVGRWYATGIVSSEYECARPHLYGLYANIHQHKRRIIETMLTQYI